MEKIIEEIIKKNGPLNILEIKQITNLSLKKIKLLLNNSEIVKCADRSGRRFYYITRMQAIEAYRKLYYEKVAEMLTESKKILNILNSSCSESLFVLAKQLIEESILLYFHVKNKRKVRDSLSTILCYFKFQLQYMLSEGYNSDALDLLDIYDSKLRLLITNKGGRNRSTEKSHRKNTFRKIEAILDNSFLPDLNKCRKIYNAPRIEFWSAYYIEKLPLVKEKKGQIKKSISKLIKRGKVHRMNLVSTIAALAIGKNLLGEKIVLAHLDTTETSISNTLESLFL